MIIISYLSDLTPGEAAYIEAVGSDERLTELGITDSTHVKCIAKAAMGGPSAYLIRGTVIALRRDTASQIRVMRTPGKVLWE